MGAGLPRADERHTVGFGCVGPPTTLVFNLPTSTTKMKRLFGKKAKKPPKPPQQNIAFGIPTNIAVGPLGFRAELDIDSTGDSYHMEWIDLIRLRC